MLIIKIELDDNQEISELISRITKLLEDNIPIDMIHNVEFIVEYHRDP